MRNLVEGFQGQAQMTSFREALNFCNLRRIPYVGFKYTWDNRREGAENTKLVLDRGFLNSLGHAKFPSARINIFLTQFRITFVY